MVNSLSNKVFLNTTLSFIFWLRLRIKKSFYVRKLSFWKSVLKFCRNIIRFNIFLSNLVCKSLIARLSFGIKNERRQKQTKDSPDTFLLKKNLLTVKHLRKHPTKIFWALLLRDVKNKINTSYIVQVKRYKKFSV